MKHTMVTFRLHRLAVALIVAGGVFVSLLIFAAGWLAGTYAAR